MRRETFKDSERGREGGLEPSVGVLKTVGAFNRRKREAEVVPENESMLTGRGQLKYSHATTSTERGGGSRKGSEQSRISHSLTAERVEIVSVCHRLIMISDNSPFFPVTTIQQRQQLPPSLPV